MDKIDKNPEMKDRIISTFAESSSFRTAEKRMKWIFKIKDVLTSDDWATIAGATAQNGQICSAYGCRDHLSIELQKHKSEIPKGTWKTLKEVNFFENSH